MTLTMDEIQIFWDGILSEDREAVLKAYRSVSKEEQLACLKHLRTMISEEGWQEAQIRSAAFALDILNKENNP